MFSVIKSKDRVLLYKIHPAIKAGVLMKTSNKTLEIGVTFII